jgi:hypothetical protein
MVMTGGRQDRSERLNLSSPTDSHWNSPSLGGLQLWLDGVVYLVNISEHFGSTTTILFMNYFLLLVVLVLGAVGYYEYTNLEQENATDDQEIVDLKGKIDNLEKENKTLDADKAQLAKDMSTAEAEVSNLTGEAKALTATPQTNSGTPAAPKPNLPPSNNLGTITTLDQKTYQNCQLLKVEAEDIVISYSDGITQIAYTLMALRP